MLDPELDSQLDHALRDVPVPAGMIDRLRRMADWPDDELELALQDIGAPGLLAARLKAIPADGSLAKALNQVEVPATLSWKLAAIPRSRRHGARRSSLLSLGSLLAMAVVCFYAVFSWQLLSRARHASQEVLAWHVFTNEQPHDLKSALPGQDLVVAFAAESAIEKVPVLSLEPPILPPFNASATNPTVDVPATVEQPTIPQEENLVSLVREFREHLLGAPPLNARDVLELESVRFPMPRGISAPLVPGYNRAFLLRTGIHPPIAPQSHAALMQCLSPISLSTASYDEASWLLANKQLPRAENVRVEDFLAHLQSGLPAPAPGNVSLHLANAPLSNGPEQGRWLGMQLLTGAAKQRAQAATHLVVAIEMTSQLERRGATTWLLSGLLKLLERLGEADRLTVVAVQNKVLFRTEPLTKHDAVLLTAQWPKKLAFSPADTRLAWQSALETAVAAQEQSPAVHLVFVTEGRHECSADLQARLKNFGSALGQNGVAVSVVDVATEPVLTPAVEEMANAILGDARKITERRTWLHYLQQKLAGDAAVVASEARLMVRFNPAVVSAYRLVGHEANSVAQLMPPSTVVDLHPGDEAPILFEILPQLAPPSTVPQGKSSGTTNAAKMDWVAECELSWINPATGKTMVKKDRWLKKQLSARWDEAPFWLRQAAITAEMAETLRGSRVALRKADWPGEAAQPAELLTLAKELRGYEGSSQSLRSLEQSLERWTQLDKK
jgi:hypothetical protein